MFRDALRSFKIFQGEIEFMKSLTYLFIDLACIIVPLIASFYPKHSFFKEWKYFFPANIIVAIIFLIWDYLFTDHGIWGFNPDYLTGIYLGNLPIEEILFFIAIPYACTFTYFAFQYLFKRSPLLKIHRKMTLILFVALLASGIVFYDQWYTFITFISLGIYLGYCYLKKLDLSLIYLSYIVILPFFFISNGILTGFATPEPIVWYNDLENFGIRMGTIPVEDTFYGFLLIIWNIHLYEYFKNRGHSSFVVS